jgi:hypothetical protein
MRALWQLLQPLLLQLCRLFECPESMRTTDNRTAWNSFHRQLYFSSLEATIKLMLLLVLRPYMHAGCLTAASSPLMMQCSAEVSQGLLLALVLM